MDDAQPAIGSDAPAPQSGQAHRSWWVRLLDGDQVWGSIDIWPKRHGLSKYRLVVFPPGLTTAERRAVRLARSWPVWGTGLWLAIAIALNAPGNGWTTFAYPTAAYILSGVAVFALAGPARANVRTLSVILIDGHRDAEATARYARLERLVLALVSADAMHRRGELTVVDHEAVWWMVYRALDQNSRAATSLGTDDRPEQR